MDKCQQKLGVLQTTVQTGRSPPNYSLYILQPGLMAPVLSPAEIDSEQAARYISMVIGDWHSFSSSRLLPPFDTFSVVPTAYRRCTQTLMSSDFIEQLLHRNKQLRTLITVGLALFNDSYKQNKYRKSSHSIHTSSSQLLNL